MQLFSCATPPVQRSIAQPVVTTPLGEVHFTAQLGSNGLADRLPNESFNVGPTGVVHVWTEQELRAELLLTRVDPDLPDHMSVIDCWGGLWRLRGLNGSQSTVLDCTWRPGYSWTDQSPDTGENLLAVEYSSDEYTVHMGAADPEDHAPARPFIEDHALRIRLSGATGDMHEAHFALAWQRRDRLGEDASSWFAAGIAPRSILDAAGCR